jgi:protein involved in polysaccharide export with SLBB domain
VLVERVQNKAPQAPRSVEERVLDSKGIKSTVKDADIVTLFKIGSEFSNAITLRGNVAAPLRYAFKPGMRIADLIPEREALIQGSYYTQKNSLVQFESGAAVSAGRVATEVRNLLEEINWDYATIERLNRTEIKTQLIQFNLYKAVVDRSPEHNLQLQPGDIVTIFGVNDVPVPMEKRTRFVTVGGEVKVPGVYQIKPGETLAQVLQRAGGVTSNGYLYGTVFTRASNRALQSQQLAKIAKEMELAASKVQLTRQQNADSTGNLVNSELALANLIQSVRSIKPTGRIALELNPAKPELPNINLEDGDSITVPPTPSFVGVYGSVFTDSSFLFKESNAVRDYLRSAGVRRDADTDSVMIVRADGSVESNEGSSMFSNVLDAKLYPGDSVYVPDRLDRETVYNKFLRGAKDWTTILYQLAVGAAAVRVLEK